jgi:hypothetical protein
VYRINQNTQLKVSLNCHFFSYCLSIGSPVMDSTPRPPPKWPRNLPEWQIGADAIVAEQAAESKADNNQAMEVGGSDSE